MRAFIIVVIVAGVAVGACNRTELPATAPGNAFAQPSTPADATPAPPAKTEPGAETSRSPVPAAATPFAAPAAPQSEWHEVTIPAGTRLPIVLETAVGSDISHVEEPVHAHLARAVSVHGEPVLAQGSRISGVVTNATRSARVKGRARVAMRFDTLVPSGEDERYTIHTTTVARTAPGTKKKDAVKIGAPAAGGAIIGGLIGGKKGAAIGTAAGGGAGTAVVLSTRGKEIHLPKGAAFTVRLSKPLTVKVRG